MKNKLVLDLATLKKDNKDLINHKKSSNKEIYYYKIDDSNKKDYQRNIGDYYVLKTLDKNNIIKTLEKDFFRITKTILNK